MIHIHTVLVALLHRKVWKGAEILFVLGLRGLSGITRKPAVRQTLDRKALDGEILPHFSADPRYQRVLFVGCDWYTRHYEAMFRDRNYTTLEVDPGRARFGGRNHVVGDLASLGKYFPDGSLDLIVCNGVIGWGLDQPAAIETAMSACVRALSPGGALILGWNDIPEKTPVPLDQIAALRELEPFPAPFLDVVRTKTYNHHSFKVLRRPLSNGPHEPPFAPGDLALPASS
ncbi:MAG: methyltransferase domain-containing protein [Vicinamibacteria bacterium]